MRACEWHGDKSMKMCDHPLPLITEPTDAIVRVTHTTVCGSDLHLYHNKVNEIYEGDILGHEGIGIVSDVGSEVKNIKVGDRVVVSAVIADGTCEFC